MYWLVIIIEFPNRDCICPLFLHLDISHVMSSKEADHGLQNVLFINLIALGGVSDVKKITQLEFLRDCSAKMESVHVRHLIVEPIDI